MDGMYLKTGFVSLLYFTTVPSVLGAISSTVIIVYFITLFKFNIVNKYYAKSWLQFLKSILKHFKNHKNYDE